MPINKVQQIKDKARTALGPLSQKSKHWLSRGQEFYRKLSARERWIIIFAGVVLGLMIIRQISLPVRQALADQRSELLSVQEDLKKGRILLERYLKLRARRDEIEREYKSVENKSGEFGEFALLERMVQEKIGAPSGQFNIKEGQGKEFGHNYDQAPFTVKFNTTSLAKVVDFLKEVTAGKQPLVLTALDLRKTRTADRLDVQVDVSSIRPKVK